MCGTQGLKGLKEREKEKGNHGYWAQRPRVGSAWPTRGSAWLKGPAPSAARGPAWLLGSARLGGPKARPRPNGSLSLSLLSLIDWSCGAGFSLTTDMQGPHVSGTGIWCGLVAIQCGYAGVWVCACLGACVCSSACCPRHNAASQRRCTATMGDEASARAKWAMLS